MVIEIPVLEILYYLEQKGIKEQTAADNVQNKLHLKLIFVLKEFSGPFTCTV